MKKSDEYSESKNAAYLKYMVEQLQSIPRKIQPASTIQCASTQATLDRDPKDDLKHFKRKIDINKAVVADFVLPNGEINPKYARQIPVSGIINFEKMRRSPKNSIGQSEKSAFSEERREAGRHAFEFSPPTPITEQDKEKIVKLEKIEILKETKEEWRPLTRMQALKHWLTGGKIRKEEIK